MPATVIEIMNDGNIAIISGVTLTRKHDGNPQDIGLKADTFYVGAIDATIARTSHCSHEAKSIKAASQWLQRLVRRATKGVQEALTGEICNTNQG